MKISFHGACREVTGSCAYLSGDNFKLLIDCGFFQGDDYIQDRNRDVFPFEASEIDFIYDYSASRKSNASCPDCKICIGHHGGT